MEVFDYRHVSIRDEGGFLSRNDRSEANFGIARDELFSHIHRCGVLRSTAEQQAEWMEDTMQYMAERFPELTKEQIGELREIGLRFCSPVIHNVVSDDAEESESAEKDSVESDSAEAAAA
jgi:hypothetical protein